MPSVWTTLAPHRPMWTSPRHCHMPPPGGLTFTDRQVQRIGSTSDEVIPAEPTCSDPTPAPVVFCAVKLQSCGSESSSKSPAGRQMPTSTSRTCGRCWLAWASRSEYAEIITSSAEPESPETELAAARFTGEAVSGQAGSRRDRAI